MLKPYYIYRHIRPDTNQVFYIGKGKNRRKSYSYERANDDVNRNQHWIRIVEKCEGKYEVEIIIELNTPEQCVAKEIEFIALYGRSDLKKGPLCNLTDGGEGGYGRVYSEEQRRARSERIKGNKHPNWGKTLSEETLQRKSESVSGDKHFLFGKTLSEDWKEHIAEAKIGEKNPMFGKYGKDHHRSMRILDTQTGEVYYGAPEAAKAAGVSTSILYQYLDGSRPNKTTMVRKEK